MAEYDLVVIGGGSAGLATSKRAAAVYKKRVVLIEKSVLGGTCVNYGCIPKKMLYNAAAVYEEAEWMTRTHPTFSWHEFRDKRNTYIAFLNEMYAKRNKNDAVHVVQGYGRVENRKVHTEEEEYTAKHVLVATGSHPILPVCPGAELCMTSDDFFRFACNPGSVIIIGAGYIAVETAFVLACFGTHVTLIARTEILRKFDAMVRDTTGAALRAHKNICVYTHTDVVQIRKDNNKKVVKIANRQTEQEIAADEVIAAIGRRANTQCIAQGGIQLAADSSIITDSTYETTCKGVYALGDAVQNEHMLTPVAIFAGRRLADYLYGTGCANIKNLVKYVPTVVFSHPPSGSVGYTEEEATYAHKDTCSTHISALHPLSVMSDSANTYKFVYGTESGVLYGVHMHGHQVDEMLQGFAVLARNSVKYASIVQYLSDTCTTLYEYMAGMQE